MGKLFIYPGEENKTFSGRGGVKAERSFEFFVNSMVLTLIWIFEDFFIMLATGCNFSL